MANATVVSENDCCCDVQVTLKALHGVEIIGNYEPLIAAIGFSGSVRMQVGSSILCGSTGRVLVESNSVSVDNKNHQGTCVLTAEWDDPSVRGEARPHMSLQLAQRCHSAASSLANTNRDSIVKQMHSTDNDDDSTATTTSHSNSTSSFAREELSPTATSAVWLNSEQAMPDIIELTIRLKLVETMEEFDVGVAYLVVFGHENDRGSYVMELPVKRPLTKQASSPRLSVNLTDQARMEVKVKVTPSVKDSAKPLSPLSLRATATSASSSSSSEDVDEEIFFTRSQLEAQIGPLLQKIRENENEAMKFREAQRRAIDIEIPVGGEKKSPVFCGAHWSWHQIVQGLASAVRRCDTGSTAVVLDDDVSVDSTIVTRESLAI